MPDDHQRLIATRYTKILLSGCDAEQVHQKSKVAQTKVSQVSRTGICVLSLVSTCRLKIGRGDINDEVRPTAHAVNLERVDSVVRLNAMPRLFLIDAHTDLPPQNILHCHVDIGAEKPRLGEDSRKFGPRLLICKALPFDIPPSMRRSAPPMRRTCPCQQRVDFAQQSSSTGASCLWTRSGHGTSSEACPLMQIC
jgi:hypothetical protein